MMVSGGFGLRGLVH